MSFAVRPGWYLVTMSSRLLDSDELLVQSRGKNKQVQKNLRPGIFSMTVENGCEVDLLTVMASINEPVNVRFDELLDLFAENGLKNKEIVDFFRQGNYIKEGTNFYLPMEKV